MDHFFFIVGFSLLLTHEMDAIRASEWRMFLGLASLPDARGYQWFTLLHVPLYIALCWGLFGDGVNQGLILGLDIFLIVHVGLHALFMRHPNNQFTSVFSWALIGGAGGAGALDLLLWWVG